MDIIRKYTAAFNAADEEVYKNTVPNADAADWLANEIPVLECPDENIERTWYFRFWTYRKHVKHTDEDGWVITEFLPKVPWSGKHNTINAAVGHHIYEGRWLKHAHTYLSDYIRFFLHQPERAHQYSAWLADAAWKLGEVTGNFDFGEEFWPLLCRYYEVWEETHQLPDGMFWSLDGRDAMEFSISGTPEGSTKPRPGSRPTLNAYMCADALALAKFARLYGDSATEAKYLEKHEQLKRLINEKLWEDGFFRAYHFDEGQFSEDAYKKDGTAPREEIGYIPWMFGIPAAGREDAFALLDDEHCFASPFGITTADRSHPRYLYEANHECLWNGYVWPFATAETLTALGNAVRQYPGAAKYRSLFVKLLTQYAASHTLTREDGTVVPWIDEVRHAERDDWSSRTILRNWGWQERKGGYERGKDYNHSTFCDLVISGLFGVKTDGETLAADPIIPEGWDFMRLSSLPFRGRLYTIVYDRTGEKFSMGSGVRIFEE